MSVPTSKTANELPYQVSDGLRQRLDLAHHLLEFGRQILVICGERGSGRTRLLTTLAGTLAAEWLVVQVRGSHDDDILAELGAALGLGQAADLATLAAALVGERAARRRVLLLIDDADEIAPAVLADLVSLALDAEEGAELRVVLAVLPASTCLDELEALAPSAAQVHVVEVPPLDRGALTALLEAWCDHAGLALDEVIPAAGLDALLTSAGGNPARALDLLAAHLEAEPPRREPVFSAYRLPPRLQRYGGVVIVAVAAVGLFALAVGERMTPRGRDAETGSAAVPGPRVLELALPGQTAAPPAASETAPTTARVNGGGAPAGASPPGPAAPAAPSARDWESAAVPPATAPPAATSTGSDTTAVPPSRPDSPPPRATTAERILPLEPVPPRAPAPAAAPKAAPTAPPTPPPAAAPAAVPTPAYSADWLLAQAGGSWVVQLFGSHDRAAATRFIANHGLGTRAAVVSATRDGKPWFVVVYGHYPQRGQANRAIAGLPTTLRDAGAWPRTIDSLRK